MQHFDGWNTMEGRHLVLAYASCILFQGAYVLWMLRSWMKLNAEEKKAAKPAN